MMKFPSSLKMQTEECPLSPKSCHSDARFIGEKSAVLSAANQQIPRAKTRASE